MQQAMLYQQLQDALKQPLPGVVAQSLMAPSMRNPQKIKHAEPPRPSAVTLLLYPENGQWYIPLIKRNVYNGQHSAQVSFPGGKQEQNDGDLEATARRETKEEIGVEIESQAILGALSPLYIPISNFRVHPYVACYDTAPEFQLDANEVQYLLKFPLKFLLNDRYKDSLILQSQGHAIQAPIYRLNDEYIWGATAMILSEFEQLLRSFQL